MPCGSRSTCFSGRSSAGVSQARPDPAHESRERDAGRTEDSVGTAASRLRLGRVQASPRRVTHCERPVESSGTPVADGQPSPIWLSLPEELSFASPDEVFGKDNPFKPTGQCDMGAYEPSFLRLSLWRLLRSSNAEHCRRHPAQSLNSTYKGS